LNHRKKYCDFVTGRFYAYGIDRKLVPANVYQNGAYWATAAGWYAGAISIVDVELAQLTLSDLVDFLKNDGIYECVYMDGYRKDKDYTISAVLPLIGFKRIEKARKSHELASSPSEGLE